MDDKFFLEQSERSFFQFLNLAFRYLDSFVAWLYSFLVHFVGVEVEFFGGALLLVIITYKNV